MERNLTIRKINITFENCESVTIDGKHIGRFDLNNIKPSVRTLGGAMFGRFDVAECIVLEVHRDANLLCIDMKCSGGREYKVFERLMEFWDITSIEVFTAEEEPMLFSALWDPDNMDENLNQSVRLGENGNLYLVISQDFDVYDVFTQRQMKNNGWAWFRDEWGVAGEKTKGDVLRYCHIAHMPTDERLNEPATEEFIKECFGCPKDMDFNEWIMEQAEMQVSLLLEQAD